ncbi:Nuclear pore complex protein NUP98A [Camellia lanceoleosa]|uniref:Nuclear pore complex protein NUP98A n=1 Tax=Camellia lanceoleosa TaxID=1840588 RepID=A0ACC0IUJ3_9ERIC|nr:Nuclear pore complex protein NUP98A [Camellia lanceoleosa]
MGSQLQHLAAAAYLKLLHLFLGLRVPPLLGDKGGQCHVGQSAGGFGVGGSTKQSNAFGPSPTLTQSSPNPFSSSVSSNPLAPQTSTPNPFPTQTSTPNPCATQTSTPNPFALQTSTPNPFALQTSTPNPFPSQTPSPNPFATQSSSPIPFPPQTFSNLLTPQTSSNLSAPQTSSPNPYASQTSSNPFAPQTISNALPPQTPYNSFAPKTPAPSSSGSVASSVLGFNSLLFGTSSFANAFKTTSSPPCSILTASGPGPASGPNSCPSLFSSSSSPVLGPSPSIFSSTSALGTASGIGSGLSSANTQSSPAFRGFVGWFIQFLVHHASHHMCFLGLGLTGFGWFNRYQTNINVPRNRKNKNQNANDLLSSTQSTEVVQPAPVVSPFGALPAMPQLSIAHPGSTPSIRYGISSMPVFDKPAAPVRLSSLLTSRHLSQRRIRLPARKYDPKSDGPKVPFFSDDGEMPTAPKAGTLFVPRENPRALVINPAEQWPQRPNNEKMSPLLRASYVHIYNNGSVYENSADKEGTSSIKSNHEPNDPCNTTFTEKEALHIITSTGCKADKAAILQEQETDVEALMPQLQRSGYYTEPQIHELAVKERAEPGFCCRVKNFVVGRHGCGNIKFLGDTDVRQLDLDSHIHFDNRELTVSMDESKKPPVGQGLNKPAEVTLLNIKCIDKKTGKQYINGPKVDKYREMLMKKAIEQGAEFVSYDPVKWEWKFRVQHF